MLITALPKNASDATFPGPPTRLIKQLFESSRADYALLERVAPVPPFFYASVLSQTIEFAVRLLTSPTLGSTRSSA